VSGTITEYGDSAFFFDGPLDLHNLGASGGKNGLPLAGEPVSIRPLSSRIGRMIFIPLFVMTDRDILPVFVSFELRELRALGTFSVFLSALRGHAPKHSERDSGATPAMIIIGGNGVIFHGSPCTKVCSHLKMPTSSSGALLRVGGERHGRHCSAEQLTELAPSHFIDIRANTCLNPLEPTRL
jgi:hypothetical protein